jgi:drug/metabolite transporter (DMT)-like permease
MGLASRGFLHRLLQFYRLPALHERVRGQKSDCEPAMPAAPSYQYHPRRAIANVIAAFFLLGSTDALVKSLSGHYDSVQIGFFRYCVTLLVILALVMRQHGGLGTLRTRRPIEHGLRGLCTALELVAFYVALAHLALPVAVSMVMVSPIAITVLGVLFLAEKMRPSGWISVGAGFIGMILVVQPTSGVNSLEGSIAAMISVTLWSIAQLLARRLSATESSNTILFYYAVVGAVLLGSVVPFVWRDPDLPALFLLLAVGVVGAIGQFFLIQAFRYGPLSLLAPFEYSALLWASLLGWIFWGEVLNGLAIAGVVMIIAACLHISRITRH